MKIIKNKKGYALVSVLLIFTFLTLVAAILMGKVLQSSKFVAVVDGSVEDRVEAENRLEHATALLEKNIQEKINSINIDNLTIDRINQVIYDEVIQTINQTNGLLKLELENNKDKYNSQIVYIQKVEDTSNRSVFNLSTKVGDTNKYFNREIAFSTIPKIFKYAVATRENLEMVGPSSVKGNVYVGNNLNFPWFGNILGCPTIEGEVTVKNKVSYNFCSPPPYTSSDELEVYYNIEEIIIEKSKMFANENIEEYERINYISFKNGRAHITNNAFISGDLVINDNNHLIVEGNLYINGGLFMDKGAKLEVNGNVYVKNNNFFMPSTLNGSLKIESNIYINENDGILNNLLDDLILSDLTLNGALYTNGTVNISGKVDTKGTIYAKRVNVNFFTNNGESLVIMSEGDINFLLNDATITDTFFYSNRNIRLYGLISNLNITGGIYGRNIELIGVNSGDSTIKINYSDQIFKNPLIGLPVSKEITSTILSEKYE